MNKKILAVVLAVLMVAILLILGIKIIGSLQETVQPNDSTSVNNSTELANEGVSVNKILNIDDNYKLERPLVKLNIKETKHEFWPVVYSDGTEKRVQEDVMYINDYEIEISNELVEKGYTTNIKNDILTITAKDNSYQCVIFQLSDNYVMPTEEEVDAFYETAEYKAWDAEEYDYEDEASSDLYWDKYDEISRNYYESLGYTAETSPDYVLSDEEMFGKYNVVEESTSSYRNGLFPGDKYCESYDWGCTTLYTIPKYYKDSYFGEDTSDFSVCLYMIECCDESTDGLGWVDLDTF